MFRTLEAVKIEETLQKLKECIVTRFPGSGLSQVRDPIVIDEASDLGQITSNMSNKIWQKITIAQALALQPSVLPVPVPASGAEPAAWP